MSPTSVRMRSNASTFVTESVGALSLRASMRGSRWMEPTAHTLRRSRLPLPMASVSHDTSACCSLRPCCLPSGSTSTARICDLALSESSVWPASLSKTT